MRKRPTRLDYCQYLLASPINHTLTHFSDHTDAMRHDAINRFLRDEKMTPGLGRVCKVQSQNEMVTKVSMAR